MKLFKNLFISILHLPMVRTPHVIMFLIFMGLPHYNFAEIKNGYERDLEVAIINIRNLESIKSKVLTADQIEKIRRWLEFDHNKVEEIKNNYKETQNLIDLLKHIDPQLYNEINNIKDHEGSITDVYIKVVDDLPGDYLGVALMEGHRENPHVCTSVYGDYTVNIMLVHNTQIRELFVLVHELGHVLYQVPHLADYTEYYNMFYKDRDQEWLVPGHRYSDPSRKSVVKTHKSFIKSFSEYKRSMKNVLAKN